MYLLPCIFCRCIFSHFPLRLAGRVIKVFMLFVARNGLAISVFMEIWFPGIGESYCNNVSIIMALHSIAKSKFLLVHQEKLEMQSLKNRRLPCK